MRKSHQATPKKPNIIYEHGDSSKVLRQKYSTKKFDLVITSPPYNVGKEYESKTSIKWIMATFNHTDPQD